jgi:AcrR family transcriptional regulator
MSKVSRDSIIQAAVRLFNQNGYHATSMVDIAHAVNIKKPSLYHHFDSKEAILLAILEHGMDRLISEIEAIAASDMDCVDKVRSAVHAHATLIASSPQGAAVFLREDRGLGKDYMEHYVAKRDRFERLFRQIVGDCIRDGSFRDTDVAISVHALLGMVNWMTRWYRQDGRLTADEIADIFADLFISGLLVRP